LRDYAKVRTAFWVRGTGKALRGDDDAQRVAFYLMTAPTGHMTGLFYLALPTLEHEIGISHEGALKGLERLSREGFAHYDPHSEVVFLPAAAREQIDEAMKPADNRVKSVRTWLVQFRKHRFYRAFLDIYAEPYHLQDLIEEGPFEGPPEPLRSQEQEQEQEQEQKQEQVCAGVPATPPPPVAANIVAAPAYGIDLPATLVLPTRKRKPPKDPLGQQLVTSATWDAYSVAYQQRYGTPPIRNAKVNGQVASFCGRVPHDEAPSIAAHYLEHNGARYVAAGHPIGMLLQDAEKLRTEWATGRRTTQHEAHAADKREGRGNEARDVFSALRDKPLGVKHGNQITS
jgi:hypothetical protein